MKKLKKTEYDSDWASNEKKMPLKPHTVGVGISSLENGE